MLTTFFVILSLLASDASSKKCIYVDPETSVPVPPCEAKAVGDDSRLCCIWLEVGFSIKSAVAHKKQPAQIIWAGGEEPTWAKESEKLCSGKGRPMLRFDKQGVGVYEVVCNIIPQCNKKRHNQGCFELQSKDMVCLIQSDQAFGKKQFSEMKCSDYEVEVPIYEKAESGVTSLASMLGHGSGKVIGKEKKKFEPIDKTKEYVCSERVYNIAIGTTPGKWAGTDTKYVICTRKSGVVPPPLDHSYRYRYGNYDAQYYGNGYGNGNAMVYALLAALTVIIMFICYCFTGVIGCGIGYTASTVLGSMAKTKKSEVTQYDEVNQI